MHAWSFPRCRVGAVPDAHLVLLLSLDNGQLENDNQFAGEREEIKKNAWKEGATGFVQV
ncbi:MAG: hypothetical protein WGN25_06840 [Candidatus Electrothrix sp. GW3-4]|uniref:hypothetical protein n=1 Tax=Candidatus Electrothrix sp. GW3-4 TaxID=3126740 RepID=UPI0030D52686